RSLRIRFSNPLQRPPSSLWQRLSSPHRSLWLPPRHPPRRIRIVSMICSASSASATVAGACEKFHKPLANRPALGAYLVGKSGMSTTTQEFEAPDTIARAARAADSYHAETDDLVGERMV